VQKHVKSGVVRIVAPCQALAGSPQSTTHLAEFLRRLLPTRTGRERIPVNASSAALASYASNGLETWILTVSLIEVESIRSGLRATYSDGVPQPNRKTGGASQSEGSSIMSTILRGRMMDSGMGGLVKWSLAA
jgi:hypothetical protein